MGEVKDYVSGKVLKDIEMALSVFQTAKESLPGTKMGDAIHKDIKKYEPLKLTIEEATKYIQESNTCATGERVCNSLHKDAEFGESVFLDELAEGMVQAKKAKYVTKEEAIFTLTKYPKYPIIITKVSGKYMEICRSLPKNCVYWNSEKYGLKCIKRQSKT